MEPMIGRKCYHHIYPWFAIEIRKRTMKRREKRAWKREAARYT
jgi:hypothetical protein